ncbi:UNVERIFIED_CONTAM: hypothetical protein RMT77_000641 [Armadillidium vulgare]
MLFRAFIFLLNVVFFQTQTINTHSFHIHSRLDESYDIYSHMALRPRALRETEFIFYPFYDGYEYGKDSEHKVYKIIDISNQNILKYALKFW